MTLKIEIDVPKGATKVDIGPALEPFITRIAYLERMARTTREKVHRPSTVYPVAPESAEAYSDSIRQSLAESRRLLQLTPDIFNSYLEAEGFSGHKSGYGNDEHTSWNKTIKAREHDTWDGNAHITVLTHDANRDKWLACVQRAIPAIIKYHDRSAYDKKLTFEEMLERLETFLPPLIQLARQADHL